MQNKETKKIASGPKQKSFVYSALIVVVLVAFLGLASYLFIHRLNTVTYVNATIGSEQFSLELADTDAAREEGLSERDSIGKNNGMLFVFDTAGDWRMWMVQMRFPIDIVWLNSDKEIVYIKHSATPAEYPEIYKAPQPSAYVIEVNAGTLNRLGVQEGDSISF